MSVDVDQLTADLMQWPQSGSLPPPPPQFRPVKPLPPIPKKPHYQPLPPPPVTRHSEEQDVIALPHKKQQTTLLEYIEAAAREKKPLDWEFDGRILPALGVPRGRISDPATAVYLPSQPEWLSVYNSASATWLDRDGKQLPHITLPAELLSQTISRYELKNALSNPDDIVGAILAIDTIAATLTTINSKSLASVQIIGRAASRFKSALASLRGQPATNGRRMRVTGVLYCMARLFAATGVMPTAKQIDRVSLNALSCNWMQVTQRRETSSGGVHLWSVVRTFLDWYLIDGIDWCSPKMRLENSTRNIREFVSGGASGFVRDWVIVNAVWIIIALCVVVVALVIYNTVLLKDHTDDKSEEHECSPTY